MQNIKIKELETERLILRKITKEDAENMYNNWASDPLVAKYVTWDVHKNIEETKEIVKMWTENYQKDDFYLWVVESKEDNTIIGSIEISKVDLKKETAEIGYCYGRNWWNKGYGTETLKKVLSFGFNELDCHLIHATHYADNKASGKVMEKSGMKYEATLRDRIKYDNNKRDDYIIYSVTKEEFNK